MKPLSERMRELSKNTQGIEQELREIAGEIRDEERTERYTIRQTNLLLGWASRIEKLVGGEQDGGDPCENDGVDYEALYATGPPGQDHDVAAPCRHCGHDWAEHRYDAVDRRLRTCTSVCDCPGYEAEEEDEPPRCRHCGCPETTHNDDGSCRYDDIDDCPGYEAEEGTKR